MKRTFYNSIEGFRGLAILMVLISHTVIVPYLYQLIPLKFGYLGVNWFFVLSGFLITEILIIEIENKKKTTTILKSFFIKRVLRIFPIYYLAIIFLMIIDVGNLREIWEWTFSHLYNIGRVFFDVDAGGYIGHTWSLNVEEQFYLIWPFLIILFKKKLFKFLIIFTALFILFKMAYYFTVNQINPDFYLATPFASFDALALGGILAYLKTYHLNRLKSILDIKWIPVVLLLIFWSLLFKLGENSFFYYIYGRIISAIAGFYFIGWCALNSKMSFVRILENKVLKYLGKISYGLYLYHYIIQYLLTDFFNEYFLVAKPYLWKFGYHPYLFYFTFILSISLIIAHFSFYFIEKPLLKLKRHFNYHGKHHYSQLQPSKVFTTDSRIHSKTEV